tara:strand:+ start:275 stop:385 length:111 start_codon:yes stop_codon:yes gene_type:complete
MQPTDSEPTNASQANLIKSDPLLGGNAGDRRFRYLI